MALDPLCHPFWKSGSELLQHHKVEERQQVGRLLTLGPTLHHHEVLVQLQEGLKVILQSHLDEGDVGRNTSLLQQALERLLFRCRQVWMQVQG